jgi:excisionase family DNA binding protein
VNTTDHSNAVEQYVHIKEASARLGIPYFKLSRFIKSGAVPFYRVGNSRRLVRISELVAAIAHASCGATK